MHVSFVYYDFLEMLYIYLTTNKFYCRLEFFTMSQRSGLVLLKWCSGNDSHYFEQGDFVALLQEELSKQDVENKKHDEEVTL